MNYFKDKKNIAILGIITLIVVVIVLSVFLLGDNNQGSVSNPNNKDFKGQVITDSLKIPNTVSVSDTEGELVLRGEYEVKLQPQSEVEEVYISNAKLTLKEAYDKAKINNWSSDAKLVFIKSNGAIGLDGRSSSWQLVYSSAQKNKNYEIIIFDNKEAVSREIDSSVAGFDIPINWYDSYEAIASLKSLPQFSTSTFSAISFYYSGAEKSWAYGIASGDKTISMWVK